ncbi:MAG: alanine racemase [Salibacteraceae bacterium]|jgi:ornithine racemase|nr:alanine racemase [Salibacteraceae bacterium]MDP4686551.1 alanine racemase [Salibacteraceae bacterium]MDP4764654.1 alanine racemase [Salibacteraceae bacterium]MDP4964706.1 alanine racemase [Salibacteraceae bacterium]
MAFITLDRAKLEHNYQFLNQFFAKRNIEWSIVSKMLCGNYDYVKLLCETGIKEICDARISNLRMVKQINPDIQTVYIKPPAKRSIKSIVKYADVSFNTQIETIKWLSEEACAQHVQHKVVIMIEMGDLREGVMGEEVVNFYSKVFELPNIEVVSFGTNLNCLHGVMPSHDKLIQLSLYKQLIEAKFNRNIPYVTGGTSVVIPLIFNGQLPKGVNHFRVGETLYFGLNLFTGEIIEGMQGDVIKLYAEVIELIVKPKVPMGEMEANPSGEVYEINEEDYGKTAYRAILDLGLLDISPEFLIPEHSGIEISGASSDMLVLDLGDESRYKVGDLVPFHLKYMGALGLMNSNYIEKKVV